MTGDTCNFMDSDDLKLEEEKNTAYKHSHMHIQSKRWGREGERIDGKGDNNII